MIIRAFSGADFDPLSRLVGSTRYAEHGSRAPWFGASELCWHLARADQGFVAVGDAGELVGAVLVAGTDGGERTSEARRHWRAQRTTTVAVARALNIDVKADDGMLLDKAGLAEEVAKERGSQGVGELVLVVVAPEERDEGVEAALLREAVAWLRENDATVVRLVAEGSSDCQPFGRLGMERVASRPCVVRQDTELCVYECAVASLAARLAGEDAPVAADRGEVVVRAAGEELDAWIGEVIDEHAAKAGVDVRSWRYAAECDGRVVAGISAWAMGPCVHIDMLAASEEARKQGLGTRLIERVEQEARACGCTMATVDTFSFQAPAYYPAHGYAEMFRHRLDDGSERVFFSKRL